MLSFHFVASVAAIVCFALTIVWLFVPQVLLSIWGVTYSDSVGLVSRRGAALFLCIGIIFLLARNTGPSPARNAISVGFIAGCLFLASLGIFELLKKRARIGIASAVIVEVGLAIGFMLQMHSG